MTLKPPETWPRLLAQQRTLRVIALAHEPTVLSQVAPQAHAFEPRLVETPIELEAVRVSANERGGIWFRFFNSCDLRCAYCDEPSLPADPVNATLALGTLAQLHRQGFDRITLSGGEPTLLRKLPEFVAQLRQVGFSWISVATNGHGLQRADFAQALCDAGISELYVSVHGADAQAASATTGRAGYWEGLERALVNVRAVSGGRLHLGLNHVVTTHSVGKLHGLAELACRHGARSLQLSLMEEYVAAKDAVPLIPRLADFSGELALVRDRLAEAGIELTLEGIPPCHLIGLERHYLDLRRSRSTQARVVYQSQAGMDTVQFSRGASRDIEKVFSDACAPCLYRTHCCGVHHSYLATHGAHDLRPVTRVPALHRQPSESPS